MPASADAPTDGRREPSIAWWACNGFVTLTLLSSAGDGCPSNERGTNLPHDPQLSIRDDDHPRLRWSCLVSTDNYTGSAPDQRSNLSSNALLEKYKRLCVGGFSLRSHCRCSDTVGPTRPAIDKKSNSAPARSPTVSQSCGALRATQLASARSVDCGPIGLSELRWLLSKALLDRWATRMEFYQRFPISALTYSVILLMLPCQLAAQMGMCVNGHAEGGEK